MKNWFGILLCAVVWCGFGIGCEDGAGGVGIDGFDRIGSSGDFRRDTLYVDDMLNDTSFVDSVVTSDMKKLYLGSVGSYDFKIIMRFTMPADVESATVRSARIEMVPSGNYGTGANLIAAVKSVRKSWSESDLLWTRFDTPDAVGDTIIPFVPVPKANDGGASVGFSLPVDTVQNWIWALTDTNRKNNGIMIDFVEGADFTQQFYSAQTKGSDNKPDPAKAPRLVVIYDIMDAGSLVTDTLTLYPAVTRAGYLGGSVYAGGQHGYVYRDRSPQASDALIVGSAIPYHGFLRFNMARIPSNATIASASLLMTLDPTGSYFYDPLDSISVQAVRVTVDPDKWTASQATTSGQDVYDLQTSLAVRARWTDKLHDDTLQLNITAFVQSWVSSPQGNHGIRLFHGYEVDGDSRLYRVKFTRDPSNQGASPRLAIYYTVPPGH